MPAHEPYQLFPDVSPDDRQALREDIRVRGVQVPVEFDEDRHILDGHQRWHICQELHLQCPSLVREGLTEEQKLEHVLQLNLSQRHLTREALEPVALMLRQRGWSLERIAKSLRVGTSTIHRWLGDVSHMEHVETAQVIIDTKGRTQPACKPRTPHGNKAAKMAATEAAGPGPEGSPPPDPLPVRPEAHVRLNQPAVEASTEPSQAPGEPPEHQVADDLGQRVRIQIDRLYGVLHPQPNKRALRALTHAWSASQKAQYRRRCTVLMGALEALREALSTAEIDCEDGDAVEAMTSADDEFSNLQELTL